MGHQTFLISCLPKSPGTDFLSCLTIYKRREKSHYFQEAPPDCLFEYSSPLTSSSIEDIIGPTRAGTPFVPSLWGVPEGLSFHSCEMRSRKLFTCSLGLQTGWSTMWVLCKSAAEFNAASLCIHLSICQMGMPIPSSKAWPEC